ncbi:MAG: alpha/beta-hydrolase family protein [Actinobacteria bacterium]|nr:alpha/beta-hydrolase family protein [Actinomycetota bacterium]
MSESEVPSEHAVDLAPVGTADVDLAGAPPGSSWLSRAESVLSVLSPLTSSPGAPLETTNFIRSVQPSLMPRTSLHQGAVSGLSILAARGVSSAVERITDRVTFGSSSLVVRLGARAAMVAAGRAVATAPDPDDQRWPAGVSRLTGELLQIGAAGGAMYDVLTRVRSGEGRDVRSLRRLGITTGVSLAVAGYASRHFLAERREFFTDDFDQLSLTLPRTLANTAAVTAAGTGIAAAFRMTRKGWIGYFGPGITRNVLGRAVNAAMWSGAVTGLYWAGISTIGRANEKVDPGYSTPPTNPLVSGSPESLASFEELGQQGRRFVLDALDPGLIDETLAEQGAATPIRIYIGFNDHPTHSQSRAETALAEMERVGAFDRRYLLLVSPTGTGWVDHTVQESAEFFARGDIATVCVQYGRYPSFLSLQKVRQGRRQFRTLVLGVHQRLMGMAPGDRPEVLVFGESLGAWSSSDVVMKSGIGGLDAYSISRALWFGMPHLARWSRAGLDRPGAMTPPGTVGVFDRWEELEQLDPEQRDALRVVQLSHDNDPITHVDPSILFRSPDWLGEPRGRNVPDGQRWYPVVTFLQTVIDAANAMRNSPGDFRSTGHDYRADTARFVAEGFRFRYSEDQLARVEATLRRLEKERAERIKGVDGSSGHEGAVASERSQVDAGDAHPTRPDARPALAGRTAGPAWITKSGLNWPGRARPPADREAQDSQVAGG